MFDFLFFFLLSQHPAWEQFLSADNLAGEHDHAAARNILEKTKVTLLHPLRSAF
jgi:hypothetical protein